MGVVNQAVEDGVGVSRVADESMPFVNGDLAGEDCRTAVRTFSLIEYKNSGLRPEMGPI